LFSVCRIVGEKFRIQTMLSVYLCVATVHFIFLPENTFTQEFSNSYGSGIHYWVPPLGFILCQLHPLLFLTPFRHSILILFLIFLSI